MIKIFDKYCSTIIICLILCFKQRVCCLAPITTPTTIKQQVLATLLHKISTISLVLISTQRPSELELNSIINDDEIDEDIMRLENYDRLDPSNDEIFYSTPRFVEHIDDSAVTYLTKSYETIFDRLSKKLYPLEKDKYLDILDICASHSSHLPFKYTGDNTNSIVSALGMNRQELNKNSQVNKDRVMQNLNTDIVLPFASDSYDVVLIQLSIDYLIEPVAVIREIARVLRKGGYFIVSFSNRVFINKAIGMWTGKSDLDHLDVVTQYVKQSRSGLKVIDIMAKDTTTGNTKLDPVYIVISEKITE